MLTCLTSYFKHILRFQNGQGLDLYRRLWTQRAFNSSEVARGPTSSGATVSASGAWDSMGPLALPTQPCTHSLLHPHHLEGSSLHSFANKCVPLPPHRSRTHHCISGWGSSCISEHGVQVSPQGRPVMAKMVLSWETRWRGLALGVEFS